MSKSLALALEVPLTLNGALASSIIRIRARDGLSYRGDDAAPELSLIAVVVLVIKMVYGLDQVHR